MRVVKGMLVERSGVMLFIIFLAVLKQVEINALIHAIIINKMITATAALQIVYPNDPNDSAKGSQE